MSSAQRGFWVFTVGVDFSGRSASTCTDTAAEELVLSGRTAGEITAVRGFLKVTVQRGLREGCLGRSCAGRGESRGLQTVVWSALLPQEDRAGDFGQVWVHLANQTHKSPTGHPGLGAVLEEGGFKLK